MQNDENKNFIAKKYTLKKIAIRALNEFRLLNNKSHRNIVRSAGVFYSEKTDMLTCVIENLDQSLRKVTLNEESALTVLA